MVEEAMILDIDIIEWEHKQELKKKDEVIKRKEETIKDKDIALQKKDEVIQQLTAKLKTLNLSEEEISKLTSGNEE